MILATLAHDAMNALICRNVRVRVRRPMAFGHRRDPSAPLSCDRRRRPGPIRCRPWVSSSLSVVYAGTSGSSLGTTVSCGSTSTDCSSGLAPFTTRLADQLAAAAAPQAVCGPLLGGALVAHAVATALDVGLYVAAPVAPAFGAKGLYRTRYRVPDAVRDRLEGRTVAVVGDVVNAGSAARPRSPSCGRPERRSSRSAPARPRRIRRDLRCRSGPRARPRRRVGEPQLDAVGLPALRRRRPARGPGRPRAARCDRRLTGPSHRRAATSAVQQHCIRRLIEVRPFYVSQSTVGPGEEILDQRKIGDASPGSVGTVDSHCKGGTIEQGVPGPHLPDGRMGHILSVYTDPQQWRRGHSRAIIQELSRWFRDRGVTRVDLPRIG